MSVIILQRIVTRELGPRSWLGRDIYAWPVNTAITTLSGAVIAYDAVNIREVEPKTGRYTKKGAFLRPNHWASLKSHEVQISANLLGKERVKFNLGGGLMGGSGGKYAGVSLRKWWRPVDTMDAVPTRKGIELSAQEWARLVALIGTIEAPSHELQEAIECGLTHNGQAAAQACVECHPFDV